MGVKKILAHSEAVQALCKEALKIYEQPARAGAAHTPVPADTSGTPGQQAADTPAASTEPQVAAAATPPLAVPPAQPRGSGRSSGKRSRTYLTPPLPCSSAPTAMTASALTSIGGLCDIVFCSHHVPLPMFTNILNVFLDLRVAQELSCQIKITSLSGSWKGPQMKPSSSGTFEWGGRLLKRSSTSCMRPKKLNGCGSPLRHYQPLHLCCCCNLCDIT